MPNAAATLVAGSSFTPRLAPTTPAPEPEHGYSIHVDQLRQPATSLTEHGYPDHEDDLADRY